ncbi:MAG: lysylphosphatidylglycerol synthase transmembrane domain-containing protein, partial [Prochlorococcaceae cyanobacterium ETNP18_MAG_17]|nr:lysylphosphatidylglycerol synthase transmembrane domain-containing protein [Prochlorococcaceae cyanobacterium ETNP18_MAG_17]
MVRKVFIGYLRSLRLWLGKVALPGGLRLWITLASLAFVVVALVSHGAQLRQLSLSRLAFWWLALGVGISWLSLVVNAFAWRVLVGWLGHRPSEVSLVPLFLSSNLLKYLPGGIWHFVERMRVLRPHMGAGPALASVLLEPLLMVVAALLWVPFGLLWVPFGGWQSGLAIACCVPTMLLIPRWREPLLRRLERAKAKQLDRADVGLVGAVSPEALGSGRDDYPWSALAMEMVFVAVRFGGFWCCVMAFSLNPSLSMGEWLAGFALAWTVGLVVPAAPGGLGVFEATLLLRLGSGVPEAPLLAVVL